MMLRPCIECGEPTNGSRCDAHARNWRPKGSYRKLGYDAAWDRLSRRARRLQPWCSDCGATEDLQGDHSPEAWVRKAAGKPIRLQDIDVVCGPCNRRRGPARPQQTTSPRQQTRRIAAIRGDTPSDALQWPRGKANFELHTNFGAGAANSKHLPANMAAT